MLWERSLASRQVLYTDCDDGHVVKGGDSADKAIDFIKNGSDDAVGGLGAVLLDERLQAIASEALSIAILCVEDAVAEENEDVAGLRVKRELVVFSDGEQSHRQSRCLNAFHLPIVTVDRTG